MIFHGMTAAACVAAGITVAGTVLPVAEVWYAAPALASAGLALRYPRAWFLVPLFLGALRETTHREHGDATRVGEPRRITGEIRVVGESGTARVVRAAGRTLRISEPPPGVPPPGHTFVATLRADPMDGRADRSAFDVPGWSRSLGLDGRARVLGPVTAVRKPASLIASARRAAASVRDRARSRLESVAPRERALLVALLLGDRRDLSDEDRDGFRRAGLAHVLALSGMHTGVLALGLGALARTVRLRGPVVVGIQVAFLAAFGFLTGGRPSILRACGTSGIALLG
ncbi:MAG: ComEC/Rec2 family competence protein, partial [Gemmatimonadetes bacterium]|nr:ComEC/Rec2 family competence protein [Gemmatimonadota bacterium]